MKRCLVLALLCAFPLLAADELIVRGAQAGTPLFTRAGGFVTWDCGAGMTCTWTAGTSTFAMNPLAGTQTYQAVDAGANDTYVATASPVLAALPAGTASVAVLFTANTSNTGGATLNLSGLGAKPIYKLADGTGLGDNDIRAGIPVLLKWDAGSNAGNGAWFVEGQLGNAPAGAPGGAAGQVQYNDGAALAGDSGLAYNAGTDSLGVIGGVVVGQPGTAAGIVSFNGMTSGTAILTVEAVAGTPTITLPTFTGVLQACKTYTVASTNAAFLAASTTATVLLETMPAKAIVTGVDVKHSVQFSDGGGAMTDVSVSVGSAGGGAAFYTTAWSIGEVTAVANTTLQGTALFKRYTAASEAMNAVFTATGRNFGDGGATFLTGGSVDIGVCWVVKQ